MLTLPVAIHLFPNGFSIFGADPCPSRHILVIMVIIIVLGELKLNISPDILKQNIPSRLEEFRVGLVKLSWVNVSKVTKYVNQ